MQSNFRERLARAIAVGYELDHGEPNRHDYRAADNVIETFGLTVETEEVSTDTMLSVIPPQYVTAIQTRVIGRWEDIPNVRMLKAVANALHVEDHSETLDEHRIVCERQDCDREAAYLSSAQRFLDTMSGEL